MDGGAPGWLSQLSVPLLISALVGISRFVSSSPALGSELTVWILLGFSLFLPLPCMQARSLSLKNKFKKINKLKNEKSWMDKDGEKERERECYLQPPTQGKPL